MSHHRPEMAELSLSCYKQVKMQSVSDDDVWKSYSQ